MTRARDLADLGDSAVGIESAWVSYTPTFSGGTWAPGNGTFTAKYKQIGKTVFVKGIFTFGSTTVKDGSTGLSMSLPVTGLDSINQPALALYLDSGTANYLGTAVLSTTTIAFQETTVSGSKIVWSGITTNAPFTWATNDVIRFTIVYEAA